MQCSLEGSARYKMSISDCSVMDNLKYTHLFILILY